MVNEYLKAIDTCWLSKGSSNSKVWINQNLIVCSRAQSSYVWPSIRGSSQTDQANNQVSLLRIKLALHESGKGYKIKI